ncbi:esterase/lipase family protein [Sorangium sp. So ce117]|uniref:esterase/lipase family protein n=1 Tax=Sorangium sp. So ce117 TaxID=3133277 RepID=UPI003F5E18ED
MLDELGEAAGEALERGFSPRVYCAGYDFRQDNAKSALRLAAIVDEALAETRERQVVIVAHGMGGLVARYYSRVLAGESKIAAVFLIGSPTLGVPAAYLQLKNGIQAVYAKNLKDALIDGDAATIMANAVDIGHGVVGLAAGLAAGQGPRSLRNLVGDLYPVLCLGAGKWLSREAMLYFVRQMPSLYQLMPNSTYCRKDPHWLYFDPLTTGYPPTGYMLVLPELLHAAVASSSGFSAAARGTSAALRHQIGNALAADHTSGRADRNIDTLAQRALRIDGVEAAVDFAIDVVERGEAAFLDGRNRERLYDDIYTGLLDRVSLRAVCAYNLALAYRFDDSLTESPKARKARTSLDLLVELVDPLVQRFAPGIMALAPPWGLRFRHRRHLNEAAFLRRRERERAEERDASCPRLYMHPRTFNIYCQTYPVDAGGLLLPLKVVSNDDSNVVYWQLIASSIAAILFPSFRTNAESWTGQASRGDGTVSEKSANPPDELLSNRFVESWSVQHGDAPSGAAHISMASHGDVVAHVKAKLDDIVMRLYG